MCSACCPSDCIQGSSKNCHSEQSEGIRLIAYCSDDVAPRGSIIDALAAACESVTILIGPEGDFAKEEVTAAIAAGFEPVHLGPSRLRTETAAITAVEAVYLTLGLCSPAYDSETAGRISKSAVPGK